MTLIVLAWGHPSEDQQKDVNQIKINRNWNFGVMVFNGDTGDKINYFCNSLCSHKEVKSIINCIKLFSN